MLDTSGLLFRRIGLSKTDWTGRSWEAVPGPRGEWFGKEEKLEAITVGQCDTLWALDSAGRVLQLSVCRCSAFENVIFLHHQVTETSLGPRNDEESEWTLVGES